MRSGTRPRPQANILPLLVDNSRSMLLKTDVGEESRREQVTRMVDEDTDLATQVRAGVRCAFVSVRFTT